MLAPFRRVRPRRYCFASHQQSQPPCTYRRRATRRAQAHESRRARSIVPVQPLPPGSNAHGSQRTHCSLGRHRSQRSKAAAVHRFTTAVAGNGEDSRRSGRDIGLRHRRQSFCVRNQKLCRVICKSRWNDKQNLNRRHIENTREFIVDSHSRACD